MTSRLLTTLTGGLLAFGVLMLWQNREVSVPEAVNAPPITQGDPAAPHQLVSILSPTCSHCADHEKQSGAMLEEAAADGDLYHVILSGHDDQRLGALYAWVFMCGAARALWSPI